MFIKLPNGKEIDLEKLKRNETNCPIIEESIDREELNYDYSDGQEGTTFIYIYEGKKYVLSGNSKTIRLVTKHAAKKYERNDFLIRSDDPRILRNRGSAKDVLSKTLGTKFRIKF